MRQQRRAISTPSRLAIAGALVLIVVGGTSGFIAAAASSQGSSSPTGVAAAPGERGRAAVSPKYAKNEKGLTYGSLQQAGSSDEAPDLILVQDTAGQNGYVLKTDLDAATGANVSSPAEAVAWQKKQDKMAAAGQTTPVRVYNSDGTTDIGLFVVPPSSPR